MKKLLLSIVLLGSSASFAQDAPTPYYGKCFEAFKMAAAAEAGNELIQSGRLSLAFEDMKVGTFYNGMNISVSLKTGNPVSYHSVLLDADLDTCSVKDAIIPKG